MYLFLEREGKGGKEGEEHQCVVASRAPPTGDLALHPGMCPGWESNWRPLVLSPVLNPLSHTSQVYSSDSYINIHQLEVLLPQVV